MTVETVGVRVDQGAGIGRDAGQDPLAQPAQGRPAEGTVAIEAALRQC